jgi:outer membrane protein OmpA-like peptidoglycan-associated protein
MRTLVRASFADGFRLAAMSALPLLGVLAFADAASAQQPSPFGPTPPPGPPGASPFGPTPPPGPPGASPFGPAPAPGAPGTSPFGPGVAPGAPGGVPRGVPGAPGDLGGQPGAVPPQDQPVPQADQPQTPAEEEQERWLSLMEHANLSGSTGLLHGAYAGSGASGTFRVGFMADWFTASSFLCRPTDFAWQGGPDKSCRNGTVTPNGYVGGGNGPSDTASRVGGTFTINVTPFSFLEAYAMLRTYATSDDQGSPQLLQVLGDTTIGVKGFLPPKLGRIFTFGGEVQLLLLNGTGGVGVSGAGTSAVLKGMGAADLRKPNDGGLPLRFLLNLGYKFDNSGQLVLGVEEARANAAGITNNSGTDPGPARLPITRIERFGLGINKVDTVQLNLGVEAVFSRVQPYIEWSADLPSNRQGYFCHTSRVSNGDLCLGLDNFDASSPKTEGGPGFAAYPSRLTLGLRTNPFSSPNLHGLSGHVAFDIGTSGVHTWVEELAPQAPWTLYLGASYAFDTREKEAPAAPPPPPPPPPQILPAPQTFVRGLVHEQGRNDVLVADAIVVFEGAVQGPVATGPDGRFVTRNLEPGTYKLGIKAPGFKPGVCQAVVPPAGAAPGALGPVPGPVATPDATGVPGMPGAAPSPFGAPPPSPFGAPGVPGGLQPMPGVPGMPGAPAVPQGPTYVDVDCPLESLPKTGSVLGVVRDAESGATISGAVVRLTDAGGKEVAATADGGGNFVFKDMTPGAVVLRGEASGYMGHSSPAEIRASEDVRPTVQLTKRPKVASVKIEGKEIRISKQIHFETDLAKIVGDSNSLLEEIADVLQHHPGLRKVEIQGHTDNTGTRDHNLQLSDARATAVKSWLVAAGVDGGRLVPKGYGQDRPLAPNVTAANRARNRRVQFIILEGTAK